MAIDEQPRASAGTTRIQTLFRLLLGALLLFTGVSHLTVARKEFLAQVPRWLPLDGDVVVVLSGIAEIGLGGALIGLARSRAAVGWIVAAFFVVIFPGNISQYVNRVDAFGIDSDWARGLAGRPAAPDGVGLVVYRCLAGVAFRV